ncbi:glycosyltransferase family 2 protein [Bordetella sp. H567]|uniref:glycosyltransferase family 2 protein n=1 Tax=Bordetella sp. H567 TaxID=1697043 RepID=UPI00082AE070|nr:glycosyltransferase [Bordetella sp. H567]
MKAFWHQAQAQLRRLFHVMGTVRRGIAQKGGVYQLAGRALSIYRREGLAGIRRGVAHMRHMVRNRAAISRVDYAAWVERYDTLDEQRRLSLAQASEALSAKPRIAVLMPVYNPVAAWLEQAIESVRRQIYPHWELCIADDASTDPEVRRLLERYKSADRRIKVAFRERNGHISAASNTALALAESEWIALLDHDDLLAEHALFWIAEAINRVPDAGIVYSDEDKITQRGIRRDPYFKPDWNYELFLSQNMISHLGAYRLDLVRDVGSFREGFEGSQDYDLALRCTERLAPSQIVHVPRVLYHWRVHAASTAKAGETKPYALDAGERALNEHLQRRGIIGAVEIQPHGLYRTRFALSSTEPSVSVIIPVGAQLSNLRRCVSSILAHTAYSNYEVLIVSNTTGSRDDMTDLTQLSCDGRIRTVKADHPGHAAACNFAVARSSAEFVVLVDSHIEAVDAEWLGEMISHAIQSGVGAVGARLLRADQTVFHAGMILGIGGIAGYGFSGFPADHPGYFGRARATQCVSAVATECLAIRRSVYLQAGGLQEAHPSLTSSADFCIRVLQAGYRNVYASYAQLYRHDGGMSGSECVKDNSQVSDVSAFKERWSNILDADPAYNPNLTLEYEDFSYAWPPRMPIVPGEGQWPREPLDGGSHRPASSSEQYIRQE